MCIGESLIWSKLILGLSPALVLVIINFFLGKTKISRKIKKAIFVSSIIVAGGWFLWVLFFISSKLDC